MDRVTYIYNSDDAAVLHPEIWNDIMPDSDCTGQIFLCPEEQVDALSQRLKLYGIKVVSADTILSFREVLTAVSKHKDAQYLSDEDMREVAEFYYEAFVKMAYAWCCTEEYYLLWDAVEQPCRRTVFRAEDGRTYMDICRESEAEGEDFLLNTLLPGRRKLSDRSFRTGHMLIRTAYMREMMELIEKSDKHRDGCFWEQILYFTEAGSLTEKSFSPYTLYGYYMMMMHSDACLLRNWNCFCLDGDLMDAARFSGQDAKWLGEEFDSARFVRGHVIREDKRELFENEDYRKKLGPSRMLHAIQGNAAESEPRAEVLEVNEALLKYENHDVKEEYQVYEEIGDRLQQENSEQAWLSWQHARFLCRDQKEKERLGKKMQSLGMSISPVAIVIVSFNARKQMRECVESIRRHCGEDEYELIVIDNDSNDGVREYLKKQRDITLICNEKNEGFPKACNQGIAVAKEGEDIFFLNNDTRMTHNALYWLRMGLYASEDTGGAGSVSNYAGIGQKIEMLLPEPEKYMVYARKVNIPMENPYTDAKILCGFAMLVRRKIIDRYGGMDEAFTPGYYEDTDLSLRIRSKGYRLRICNNSFIYHAGGLSFGKRTDLDNFTDRNLVLLASRWGTDFMN